MQLLLGGGGILAAPPDGIVDWNAPEACPSAPDVRARVERYLGRRVTDEDAQQVVARANVEHSQAGYAMRMSLVSPSGTSTKQFEAETCTVLVDAFALELALAVDPIRALDQFSRAPEQAEEPGAAVPPADTDEGAARDSPVVPAEEPRRRSHTHDDRTRLRAALRVEGGVLVGPLPGVTGGITLAVGLLGPRWRVDVAGQYWFPAGARFPDEPDVGGDLTLGLVMLRACPVPRLGPVELPVCGGIEAGAMRGDPVGARASQVRHRAWLGFTGGFAALWPFHRRLALWLAGDAVLPVLRPGFRIEGLGTLHVAARVGARGTGGLEVRF